MRTPPSDQAAPQAGDGSAMARVAAVSAVLCWSTGNVIVAEVDMPGLAIAFWRLVLGAVLYATVLHAMGRRITWAQVRLAAPAAITFALELGFFFTALHHTSVANATTIGSLQTCLLYTSPSPRDKRQ